jgi:hypothetical protein
VTTYTWTIQTEPRRRPANEVGIYLHKHTHDWRESGTHTWPSGISEPVFRCGRCGDTICSPAVT